MKEILLKTKNLSKSFSSSGALQHVLKNIDFEQIVSMVKMGAVGKLVDIASSDGDVVEIYVE